MKKQIVALTLAMAVTIVCCAFTSAGAEIVESKNSAPTVETVVEYVTQTIEVDKSFRVEIIDSFEDPDLFTYTLDQLKTLIDNNRAVQAVAHELAESARTLGWPEDSATIESAKAEWLNAQIAIEVYSARYEELYIESEQAKWDAKAAEYPVATKVWLYMKDLGWNDYVCAGIMGNLMAEVGGQTLDIQPTLYSSGKYFYGMCQWSKKYYPEIHGTDFATQCNFLKDTIKYEIDTFGYAYSKGFNFDSFLNMSNERDAAKAFAKCYERCSSSTYTIRQNNAEKAYDYFVNN